MSPRMKRLLAAGAAYAAVGATAALTQAPDPKKGREVYVKVGCWSCHGYNGQGGTPGPRIAPEPLPVEALAAYIRGSAKTLMPPYHAANLGDADIALIHAWLAAQPKTPDWKTIPLLQP